MFRILAVLMSFGALVACNGASDLDKAPVPLGDFKQITVFEAFDQGPIVGSGYTKTAEEQLKNLSQNAAKSIENYLVKQNEAEGWFNRPLDAVITRAPKKQE